MFAYSDGIYNTNLQKVGVFKRYVNVNPFDIISL